MGGVVSGDIIRKIRRCHWLWTCLMQVPGPDVRGRGRGAFSRIRSSCGRRRGGGIIRRGLLGGHGSL